MSEIAIYDRTDLTVFAEEASQVHKVAQALAGTSFVPKAFTGRPDEITGAILFGRELGLSPMTALQIVNVIQGRPTLSAVGMRGLAMSIGVIFHVVEQSDTRVIMRAQAPRQEQWTEAVWTIQRATKMGLTDKDNWKRQPQAMLVARCTSELCRLVAADVLLGIPYSSEELADMEAPVPEQVKQTRTVRRRPDYDAPGPALEPAPEPAPQLTAAPDVIDQPLPEDDVAPQSGSPISMNTRKAVMAAFSDAGIQERARRLHIASTVAGRQVLSVNQLTEDEGHLLLVEVASRAGDVST